MNCLTANVHAAVEYKISHSYRIVGSFWGQQILYFGADHFDISGNTMLS